MSSYQKNLRDRKQVHRKFFRDIIVKLHSSNSISQTQLLLKSFHASWLTCQTGLQTGRDGMGKSYLLKSFLNASLTVKEPLSPKVLCEHDEVSLISPTMD